MSKKKGITRKHTFRQCQREAERELAMRRRVYPNQIRNGKLTSHQARIQISIMEQIVDDYKRGADREERKRAPELPLNTASSETK